MAMVGAYAAAVILGVSGLLLIILSFTGPICGPTTVRYLEYTQCYVNRAAVRECIYNTSAGTAIEFMRPTWCGAGSCGRTNDSIVIICPANRAGSNDEYVVIDEGTAVLTTIAGAAILIAGISLGILMVAAVGLGSSSPRGKSNDGPPNTDDSMIDLDPQ